MSERKLTAVVLTVFLVMASLSGSGTLALLSDSKTVQVTVSSGNVASRVIDGGHSAGNTPLGRTRNSNDTQTSSQFTTDTPTPTPEEPKKAFSFAAFCTDAEALSSDDITVTPEVTKIDEPDEVLAFNWTSTVAIDRIVTKRGQTMTVHWDLISPTHGLIVRGSGKEPIRPVTPADPCPESDSWVKIEFEEDSGEKDDDSDGEEDDDSNNGGKESQSNSPSPQARTP